MPIPKYLPQNPSNYGNKNSQKYNSILGQSPQNLPPKNRLKRFQKNGIGIAKSRRILAIFLVFVLSAVIFLFSVYSKVALPRESKMPTLIVAKEDVAVRGNIYTAKTYRDDEGYSLARSNKLYKLGFNPRSIDPNKKELFITLLEIYSGVPRYTIIEKLKNPKYQILSYKISPNVAANLRALNAKLLAYDVFREYIDEKGRVIGKMGLSVEVSGVSREYPYNDMLEPFIGYVTKSEIGRLTMPIGVDGIENSREKILRQKQNGEVVGKRDIGFNIIQTKQAHSTSREDGFSVRLGIPFSLQQKLEELLDSAKKEYQSQEIIAAILNPKNGQILAIATTNRFNPNAIREQDKPHLKIRAIAESFEPGSTIKPIIYAMLLEKKLINPLSPIDLGNGYYMLGKHTITDDTIMPQNPTIEDVLLHSSNVGMILLSNRLNGQEFYDGLRSFGLGSLTGIDLPYERDGIVPSVKELSKSSGTTKKSVSFGYVARVTFMQLLRAYGVFANGGYLVTPHITQSYIAPDGKIYIPTTRTAKPTQAISEATAKKMQSLLIKVVESGTGKAAKVEQAGIITGGKTGTAREIAQSGGYGQKHNGSFFGFVKDAQNTFVIGVVTFGASGQHYYGSQNSAPVFKKIVDILIEQGYLQTKTKKR